MKLIEYRANNSGGGWWHTEEMLDDLEKAAVAEFEEITGLDTNDEGCVCCGPPHDFQEVDMGEQQ